VEVVGMRRASAAAAATILAVLSAVAAPAYGAGPGKEPKYAAKSFDPQVESTNYSIGLERQNEYLTPQYQEQLRKISIRNHNASIAMQTADPDREFADLCGDGMDGCAGDTRLYGWQHDHYGIVTPFLFTARDGATLSGHVWATRKGPAKRPGIVITNGSVQADEQLYWYVAQALAKDGYVVMTFDPQGQGQSDSRGEGADADEGFPAQSDGRPFFDGTEDAIDFFLSTPKHPYKPVPSCSSGTSHAKKQRARVKAGFDAAYDPFWKILDRHRLGIAGHSYGASGVSYIGQWDKRVDAIVAWDNLAPPNPNRSGFGGGGPEEQGCVAKRDRRPAKIRVPALGMSADYFLPPTPNTSLPDPKAKSTESLVYSKHHVDTGEIIIRGGSHLDFSYIPNSGFPASLRGASMIDWYTSAWFDRYVKGHKSAYRKLVSRRWRHDGLEASVDPWHDGNAFSFYYRSRLDIAKPGGGRFHCESLRKGCRGMTNHDGYRGVYDYVAIDRSRDGKSTHPVPKGHGLRLPDAK
jgi:dienelactone hydrolase